MAVSIQLAFLTLYGLMLFNCFLISFDPKNPKFVDHTDSIRSLISKALAEWSGSSKLSFTEISSMDADIILSFESRRHGV